MSNNHIEDFLVEVQGEGSGSGILVKPTEGATVCYIFTARHVLLKNKNTEENIQNKVEYKVFYKKEKLELLDEKLYIDEDYDLAIFILDLKNQYNKKILENLNKLVIYNDDFDICMGVGYPHIRSELSIKTGYYEFRFNRYIKEIPEKETLQEEILQEETSLYEIIANQVLFCPENSQHDNMQGFSGSGILVKNNNTYYLSGIAIKSLNQQALVCLSLTNLFQHIQTKLKSYLPYFDSEIEKNTIQIGGYSYREELGISDNELNQKYLKDLINTQLDGESSSSLIKEIQEKRDTEQQLEYIKFGGEFYKKLEKKAKELDEIPIVYLYQALLFDENNEHKKATNNFKKAVKYRSDFQAYFDKAKAMRAINSHKETKAQTLNELTAEESVLNYNDIESLENYLEQLELLPDNEKKKEKYTEKLERIYTAILDYYQKEKALSSNKNTENDEKIAEVYFHLGNIYLGRQEYITANNSFSHSLDMKDIELLKEAKQKLLYTYCKVIDVYKNEEENKPKIIDILEEAEKFLDKYEIEPNQSSGKIYTTFARHFFQNEDFDETKKYLDKALSVYIKLNIGENCFNRKVISIYSSLAKNDRYLKNREHVNSIIYFEKAKKSLNKDDNYQHFCDLIAKRQQAHLAHSNKKEMRVLKRVLTEQTEKMGCIQTKLQYIQDIQENYQSNMDAINTATTSQEQKINDEIKNLHSILNDIFTHIKDK